MSVVVPGSSARQLRRHAPGSLVPHRDVRDGVKAATYGALVSGSYGCGPAVTRTARRAATSPMSEPGAVPTCEATPGSAAAPLARRVQSARARTRAAASASRSSGSSPSRTAATSASRSRSTVSSSARPPPTQIASAPAAIARTEPCSMPYVDEMACISMPSVTIRPCSPALRAADR